MKPIWTIVDYWNTVSLMDYSDLCFPFVSLKVCLLFYRYLIVTSGNSRRGGEACKIKISQIFTAEYLRELKSINHLNAQNSGLATEIPHPRMSTHPIDYVISSHVQTHRNIYTQGHTFGRKWKNIYIPVHIYRCTYIHVHSWVYMEKHPQ